MSEIRDMQIAIITARGGSKRIPRKNIRSFLGKPMIAWSIEAAQKAGCFDHILVSTDDQEIADVALEFGAEVPFLRPVELADDYTPAHIAARQMLEWAALELGEIEYFSHIYPTAPTITPDNLKKSMDILSEGKFKSVWAVVNIPYPIYQFMVKGIDGNLERLFPEDKVMMRSQDMPEVFIDAGQFYSFEADFFLKHELALSAEVTGIEISYEAAIDIDTEEDWKRAEQFIGFLNH